MAKQIKFHKGAFYNKHNDAIVAESDQEFYWHLTIQLAELATTLKAYSLDEPFQTDLGKLIDHLYYLKGRISTVKLGNSSFTIQDVDETA